MSTVYRGMDLRLDRPSRSRSWTRASPPTRSSLPASSARPALVATLKHPGLVAVYDQGSGRRLVFLVMELVDGGTLRELLRERGPMSVRTLSAIARTGARRARRRARRRPGAPRHQARERADLRRGRGEDRRLRPGPRGAARKIDHRAASSSAPLPTCLPSRSPPAPPTPAATCTPPASWPTRCSPAARRTPATRHVGGLPADTPSKCRRSEHGDRRVPTQFDELVLLRSQQYLN